MDGNNEENPELTPNSLNQRQNENGLSNVENIEQNDREEEKEYSQREPRVSNNSRQDE